MNLTAVENELKNIPFMKRNQTEIIREIFKTYKIKNVFELLVKDHKDYHNFEIINDNWGFAQKKS